MCKRSIGKNEISKKINKFLGSANSFELIFTCILICVNCILQFVNAYLKQCSVGGNTIFYRDNHIFLHRILLRMG